MIRRLMTVASLATILVAATSARGQDKPEKHDELISMDREVTLVLRQQTNPDSTNHEAEGDDDRPTPVPPRPKVSPYVVAEANFDDWTFGANVGPDERRSRLDSVLKVELKAAIEEYHLTDVEAAKLRLAGVGDIKRFLDQLDGSRREFNSVREDLGKALKTLNDLRQLSMEFQGCPFGNRSLFAKTLEKIRADRGDADKPRRPHDRG